MRQHLATLRLGWVLSCNGLRQASETEVRLACPAWHMHLPVAGQYYSKPCIYGYHAVLGLVNSVSKMESYLQAMHDPYWPAKALLVKHKPLAPSVVAR